MKRIQEEYFCDSPKYSQREFERRFRLPRFVFDLIANALFGRGLFVSRVDELKKKGIHPLQRICAALGMMEYGVAADALDNYLQLSEDAVLLSTKTICEEVIQHFGNDYVRAPTEQTQTHHEDQCGSPFTGCVESIDCQHW